MANAEPTLADLKKMTEGERSLYLITMMNANCTAVEKLIKYNSIEHESILASVSEVDKELFTKIDELKREKISNRLFYSAMGLITAILLAFSGTLYWSGKEITKNSTTISGIERKVFNTTASKEMPGM